MRSPYGSLSVSAAAEGWAMGRAALREPPCEKGTPSYLLFFYCFFSKHKICQINMIDQFLMTTWMLCKNVMKCYFIIIYILYYFIISNLSADLQVLQQTPEKSGVLTRLTKDCMKSPVMTLHWGAGNEMEQILPSRTWRTKET